MKLSIQKSFLFVVLAAMALVATPKQAHALSFFEAITPRVAPDGTLLFSIADINPGNASPDLAITLPFQALQDQLFTGKTFLAFGETDEIFKDTVRLIGEVSSGVNINRSGFHVGPSHPSPFFDTSIFIPMFFGGDSPVNTKDVQTAFAPSALGFSQSATTQYSAIDSLNTGSSIQIVGQRVLKSGTFSFYSGTAGTPTPTKHDIYLRRGDTLAFFEQSLDGDDDFNDHILLFRDKDSTVNTPEPATMFLFGVGLLGFRLKRFFGC